MRRVESLVVAGLGMLLLSCASLGMGKFEAPSFTLTGVTVRGLGVSGGTVDLLLDVTNPNRFDLRGTRLDLGLDVEGTHLGDMVLDDAFHLPRNQVTSLVVPLSFTWAGVGAAARSALNYGTVAYTLKGTASLQTPFGLEKVPFTREGSVAVGRSGTGP